MPNSALAFNTVAHPAGREAADKNDLVHAPPPVDPYYKSNQRFNRVGLAQQNLSKLYQLQQKAMVNENDRND